MERKLERVLASERESERVPTSEGAKSVPDEQRVKENANQVGSWRGAKEIKRA